MDALTDGSDDGFATLALPANARERFEALKTLLAAANERLNLTAIEDDGEIDRKHILDSLSLLPSLPTNARALIDIGSGAGFPALPIAIARPDIAVTALEATAKKAAFIADAAAALSLPNVTVVNARAEDAGRDENLRERFDVAVARAVALLPTLAEYALPFVKVGGRFIAMKAECEDPAAATSAVAALGGRYLGASAVGEGRVLHLFAKEHRTPAAYPRRAGIPKKRPL